MTSIVLRTHCQASPIGKNARTSRGIALGIGWARHVDPKLESLPLARHVVSIAGTAFFFRPDSQSATQESHQLRHVLCLVTHPPRETEGRSQAHSGV